MEGGLPAALIMGWRHTRTTYTSTRYPFIPAIQPADCSVHSSKQSNHTWACTGDNSVS